MEGSRRVFALLLVTILCSLTPTTAKWYCGTLGLETMAKVIATATCGDQAAHANMCCKDHDICYEDVTLGQIFCDNAFCSCLIGQWLDHHRNPMCLPTLLRACSLVREYGNLVKDVPITIDGIQDVQISQRVEKQEFDVEGEKWNDSERKDWKKRMEFYTKFIGDTEGHMHLGYPWTIPKH